MYLCAMLRSLILILIVFCFFSVVKGQESDIGAWYMYFGNAKIAKKFNWHHEVQWRNYDHGKDLEQLLLRTGVGYDLIPQKLNVMLGYAYIHSQPYIDGVPEKRFVDEHRLFQQLTLRHQYKRVLMQHRLRLEERSISENYKVRFRYFFGINIPLQKAEMTAGAVYLSLYNEVFLNADQNAFDRNRVYAAAGYVISKALRIEAGGMSQILRHTHRPQFQLALYTMFPVVRQKKIPVL